MSKIIILCLEDEPEVRSAVERDLSPYAEHFQIECAEDVPDAEDVVRTNLALGNKLGLILCDHMLPGETGVDFLVRLHGQPETHFTRKVLITGQAGQQDTIRAVNQADLHHYIAKPWKKEELQEVVKQQLTEFVMAEEDNLIPYVAVLDGQRLLQEIAERGSDN